MRPVCMRRRGTAADPRKFEPRLDSARHLQRELPVGRLPQRHRPSRQYGARGRAVLQQPGQRNPLERRGPTCRPPSSRAPGPGSKFPADQADRRSEPRPGLRKSDAEDWRAVVVRGHRPDSELDSRRCTSTESDSRGGHEIGRRSFSPQKNTCASARMMHWLCVGLLRMPLLTR